MDTHVDVVISSAHGIPEPVVIAAEHRYLGSFTTFGVSPAVDGESSDGKFLLLEFDPPRTPQFLMNIAVTSAEDSSVRSSGTLKVYLGNELVSTIELET